MRAVGGLDDRLRRDRADAGRAPRCTASRRRTSATARPTPSSPVVGVAARRSSTCRGASRGRAYRTAADGPCSARARDRPRASCAPTATSRPARRASPAPSCTACDDPDVPVVADRARRRLAGQGRRASARCSRPRACRSAASAWTCASRGCADREPGGADVGPAGDHPAPAPARLSPDHARRARGVPELGELRVGLLHVLHPPHVRLADAERERLARRARRLRGLVQRGRPRGRAATGRTRSRARTTCPRTSRRRCSARR